MFHLTATYSRMFISLLASRRDAEMKHYVIDAVYTFNPTIGPRMVELTSCLVHATLAQTPLT